MKNLLRKSLLSVAVLSTVLLYSCGEDDDAAIEPNGGAISGGPFSFIVDGTPDMVSGITLDDSDVMGTNSSWVITDADNNILGLPGTMEMLEGVDFDGAGAGVCFIWYLRYEGELTGLEAGMSADNLSGSFDLSNSIMVTRSALNAGTLSGGPFTFIVDGTPDMVSGITIDNSAATGDNSTWLITSEAGEILGMPPSLEAVEGVDFDGAGAGVCLIWYMRYGNDLTGLELGANTSDLDADKFGLSNSITVTRNALNAGTISGGPFEFVVDGVVDNVSGITIDNSEAVGDNSTWVITNEAGEILGLPATLENVEGVDFDAAGAGVCFIWYMRYGDALTSLEVGTNTSDLTEGAFILSNSVMVTRNANGNMALDLNGLADLGADFVYEGWVLVDGSPVSTGIFTVDADGALSQTDFPVNGTMLASATKFILTIEPAVDSDPAPSANKLVAGDFSGTTATVSTGTAPALGDFSNSTGTYFLRTPTDETAGSENNGNDFNGIWFGTPGAPPTANFTLPTLGEGWIYEGWVVTENGPLSTGTFTDFGAADSGNPFSGTENNVGPPVPGEDFFIAPAGSTDTFPIDVRGKTVVISVEPVPDNSPAPFLLKPLVSMVAADAATAPTAHDFGQNLDSLPTGSVSRQ